RAIADEAFTAGSVVTLPVPGGTGHYMNQVEIAIEEGKVNILPLDYLRMNDLNAQFNLQFVGTGGAPAVMPSADTPLVITLAVPDGATIRLPGIAHGFPANANPFAPYILWNIVPAVDDGSPHTIQINGAETSGSILAPF